MINDAAFIGQSSPKTNLSDPQELSFNKIAELLGSQQSVPEDDPFPTGTLVEFNLPNDVVRHGRIASKCGDEYLVSINDGESCLVPIGKMIKIDADKIADIAKQEFEPQIKVLGEFVENNKHIASITYKERHPSDSQIIAWAAKHFPDLRLVDAVDRDDRKVDLVFEIQAAEDVRPQGGNQDVRGMGLARESIPGTGVIGALDESFTGVSEADIEEGTKVELEHTSDENTARQIAVDHLAEDPRYYKELGKMEKKLEEKKSFVLSEVVPQSYELGDIVKQAVDTYAALADSVLSEHGGYSADAHRDFTARLTKLAVDPHVKDYWSKYFGDYGKQWTRDIPRKKHKKQSAYTSPRVDIKLTNPETDEDEEVIVYFDVEPDMSGRDANYPHTVEYASGEKVAIEEACEKYKINKNDINNKVEEAIELGSEIDPDISEPEIMYDDPHTRKYSAFYLLKTAGSDYAAIIEEKGGKYEVKSEKNPDWSGGTYDTKEEAEKRLGEIEMFKEASIGFKRVALSWSSVKDIKDAKSIASWAIQQAYESRDWDLLDYIGTIADQYFHKVPKRILSGLGEAAQRAVAFFYGLLSNKGILGKVKNFLRNWDKRQETESFKKTELQRHKDILKKRQTGVEPASEKEQLSPEETAKLQEEFEQYHKKVPQVKTEPTSEPVPEDVSGSEFSEGWSTLANRIAQKHTEKYLKLLARYNLIKLYAVFQQQRKNLHGYADKLKKLQGFQLKLDSSPTKDHKNEIKVHNAIKAVQNKIKAITKTLEETYPKLKKLKEKVGEDVKTVETPEGTRLKIKELRPEELDYMINYIRDVQGKKPEEEIQKEEEIKKSPLLTTTKLEEVRPEYQQPERKIEQIKKTPIKDLLTKKKELQKELSLYSDDFKKHLESTGAKESISLWKFPVSNLNAEESNNPDIIKAQKIFGGLEFQQAIDFIAKPDSEERDMFIKLLENVYPEIYLAYIAQTVGDVKSPQVLTLKENLENLHGGKIDIPEEYAPLHAPVVSRKYNPYEEAERDPERATQLEEYLRTITQIKTHEEEDRKRKEEEVKKREEEGLPEKIKPFPLKFPKEMKEKVSDEELEKEFEQFHKKKPITLEERIEQETYEEQESMQVPKRLKTPTGRPFEIGYPESTITRIQREKGIPVPPTEGEEIEKMQAVGNKIAAKPKLKETSRGIELSDEDVGIAGELADPNSELSKKLHAVRRYIPYPRSGWNRLDPYTQQRASGFADMTIEQIINMADDFGRDLLVAAMHRQEPGIQVAFSILLKEAGYEFEQFRKKKTKEVRKKIKEAPIGTYGGEPVTPLKADPRTKKERPGKTTPRPVEVRRPGVEKVPEELKGFKILLWQFPVDDQRYKGKTIRDAFREINKAPEADGEGLKQELENYLAIAYPNIWLEYYKNTIKDDPSAEKLFNEEEARIKDITTISDPLSYPHMSEKERREQEQQYLDEGFREFKDLYRKDRNILIPELAEIAYKNYEKGDPALQIYVSKMFKDSKQDDKLREFSSYFMSHINDKELKVQFEDLEQQKKTPGGISLTAPPAQNYPWYNYDMVTARMLAEKMDIDAGGGAKHRVELENYLLKKYPLQFDQLLTLERQQDRIKLKLDHNKTKREQTKPTPVEREAPEKADLVLVTKTMVGGEPTYKEVTIEEFKEMSELEKRDLEKIPRRTLEKQQKEMAEAEESKEKIEKLPPFKKIKAPPVIELEEVDREKLIMELEKELAGKQKALKALESEGTSEEELEGIKGASMKKKSDAGPEPSAYNAPGKDDKKDYEHKERNRQPARNMNKFEVTRMFSTSSSEDNGYVIMEIAWKPELFEDMSPQNVQHQIISFVKGLESDKYFHDFGIMGKPKIMEFDQDAGVARLKVRCSETRGIATLQYEADPEDNMVPLVGIR